MCGVKNLKKRNSLYILSLESIKKARKDDDAVLFSYFIVFIIHLYVSLIFFYFYTSSSFTHHTPKLLAPACSEIYSTPSVLPYFLPFILVSIPVLKCGSCIHG